MVSIQSLHTFGLQASAKDIIHIKQINDLHVLLGKTYNTDFIIIGEGSNSVFIEDYQGVLVRIELKGIAIDECKDFQYLDVAAGENWHEFVGFCLKHQIYGLENLALIPGTVGACPIQNIGAYGVEVCRFIDTVQYFDLATGAVKELSGEQCQFGYRDSIFKQELLGKAIVTNVRFKFPKKWVPENSYGDLQSLSELTAENIYQKVIEIRQSKLPDPNLLGNAGSFFKNPVVTKEKLTQLQQAHPYVPFYPMADDKFKLAAGWLIDQAGLKGKTFNGVAVHDKQALVLVNKTGDATGEDLLLAIREIIKTVKAQYQITIEPEVRVYGQNGEQKIDWSKVSC